MQKIGMVIRHCIGKLFHCLTDTFDVFDVKMTQLLFIKCTNSEDVTILIHRRCKHKI